MGVVTAAVTAQQAVGIVLALLAVVAWGLYLLANSRRAKPEVGAESEIGFPGEFPYTRGVYPSMYRGRLWTMRQFACFGTPEDTNKRF